MTSYVETLRRAYLGAGGGNAGLRAVADLVHERAAERVMDICSAQPPDHVIAALTAERDAAVARAEQAEQDGEAKYQLALRAAKRHNEARARAEAAEAQASTFRTYLANAQGAVDAEREMRQRAEAQAKEWRENSARLEAARARCEADAIREGDRADRAGAEAKRLRERFELLKTNVALWQHGDDCDTAYGCTCGLSDLQALFADEALKPEPLFARRIPPC